MIYKIIKTTDGKMRGTKIEIDENIGIFDVMKEIQNILNVEIDTFTFSLPYIQLNNANYTIILKEVN